MEMYPENTPINDCNNEEHILKNPPIKKKIPHKKIVRWLITGVAVLLVFAILLPLINAFLLAPLKVFAAESLIKVQQYEIAHYLLMRCGNNEDAQKLLDNFDITYGYQKVTVYNVDDTLYRTVITERNSDGNPTQEVAYDKNSKAIYTQDYRYDSFGNLIEEMYTNGAYINSEKTEYLYGSNGNILEKTRYFPATEHTRVINSKYDERGNLIETTDYYLGGELICKYLYTYDENDNRILYIATEVDNDVTGVRGVREETVYDENGNKVKETNFYEGEYISHLEYRYTSSGKIEFEALYKKTGLSHKTEYTYDSKDRLIEVTNYNSNGNSRTTYAYDSKDRLIEVKIYDSNGNSRTTHTYNNRGDKIQTEVYKNNAFDYKFTYKYDIRGNLLSWNKCDEDGNVTKVQQLKYDLRNNKTKDVYYGTDGIETEKIEMKYGLFGNISKRQEYLMGNLKKEYFYDLFGNMTKVYVDSYYDDFATYGIQEVGRCIVEYDKPIILYKPEAQ